LNEKNQKSRSYERMIKKVWDTFE